MLKAIVLMLMLTVGLPVFADQSLPLARSAARLGSLRAAQSHPYGKLFAPQKTVLQPAIESQPAAKRRVVCGLTIIPVEPKSDPLMVLQPKVDGIDYTIRAIDPPICNPR